MNKNLIKIAGTYNNLADSEKFNIFCTMTIDPNKNLEKVLNYLGIKKIEHVVEEEQDDYASLTLYDVSLQELNVINKL